MRKTVARGALLGAFLLGVGTSTTAQAAPLTPFATLVVGGQTHNLTLTADPTKGTRYFVDQVISSDAFEILVTATLDADPSILFGITVANFGAAPLAVSLSIGLPFAPTFDSTVVSSSLRGTLNPGPQAPAGITIQPTQAVDTDGDGLLELLVNSGGDPFQNLGIDVGLGTSAPGLYGPFPATTLRPANPLFTFLQADLGFTLTGGGDVADLQGFTQVQAVPEPATLGLLGLGLVALAKGMRGTAPGPGGERHDEHASNVRDV